MSDAETNQGAEHTEAQVFPEDSDDIEFQAGLEMANEDQDETGGGETEGSAPAESKTEAEPAKEPAKVETKAEEKPEEKAEERAAEEAATQPETPDFSKIEDPAERFKARADHFDPLYQAELAKIQKVQEDAEKAQEEAAKSAPPPPPQPLNDNAAKFLLQTIKPEELPAMIELGKDEDGNDLSLDMRRFEDDFPEHAMASKLYAGMMTARMLQKVFKSGQVIMRDDLKPMLDAMGNLSARLNQAELWRRVEKTLPGAEDMRQSKEFASWIKTLPEKQRRLADVYLPDIQHDLISTFKKTQEAGKKAVEHDKKVAEKKKKVDSLMADTITTKTTTPAGKALSAEEEFMEGFGSV